MSRPLVVAGHLGGAARLLLPATVWDLAVAHWVMSDDPDDECVDRIGGKLLTPSATGAVWNPVANAWDLDGIAGYLTTPDHADFDFDGDDDFTVRLAMESLTIGQLDKVLVSKKSDNNNTAAGWNVRTSATTGNLVLTAADGTNGASVITQAMPTGAAAVGARMAGDSGRTFVDEVASAAVSFAGVGSLVNSNALRIGASAHATTPAKFWHGRVWELTVWRLALDL